MLTVRVFCLAVWILLLASCASQPNRTLPTPYIPRGMRAVSIIVKQNITAPGDHVDLLGMDKGQEVIVLQNVEVVTREENVVQFVVTPEDAKLVHEARATLRSKMQQHEPTALREWVPLSPQTGTSTSKNRWPARRLQHSTS